jgi:ribonuclease HI
MFHPMSQFGSVQVERSQDPITVAADAAVNPARGVYGAAFLATNGGYGLVLRAIDRRDGTDITTVGELKAVSYALQRMPRSPNLRVLSDSRSAVAMLRHWQNGGESYPDGYQLSMRDTGVPRLIETRKTILAAPGRFEFVWVPGHDGHPLNEFADSAAKLAMRVGTHDAERADAKKLPQIWAATRLADWMSLQSGVNREAA